MKALTVRQPWASLVLSGAQQFVVRPAPTRYRGPLAIHSGARWDAVPAPYWREGNVLRSPDRCTPAPCGLVLGRVDLVEVVPAQDLADLLLAPCTPTDWAWVLQAPAWFDEPVAAKGNLSLWNFDPVA